MTADGILVSTKDNQVQMRKQPEDGRYVVVERTKPVNKPTVNIVSAYWKFCEIAEANRYTLEDYIFHKSEPTVK